MEDTIMYKLEEVDIKYKEKIQIQNILNGINIVILQKKIIKYIQIY